MARIQPARPKGIDVVRRGVYAYVSRAYGRILEPVGVLAHHRAMLLGFSAIGLSLERFSHSVDKRLKDLAMLRTSQLVGCEWCLDFGSKLAQDSGVPEQDLRELSRWRESERFDERDRIVLEYAEAMTRTPLEVPDELFERLRLHFDERQLVELTMAIGLENLYSRTNWALGIEGEGLSEGMYCAVPDSALVTGSAAR
jgi:AhpD family alkylhydroperoxidase